MISIFRDKIVTGSFDKTAKIWCSRTGHCTTTMRGHNAEVVVAKFSPIYTKIATGSLDMTSRIFDITTGIYIKSENYYLTSLFNMNFANKI